MRRAVTGGQFIKGRHYPLFLSLGPERYLGPTCPEASDALTEMRALRGQTSRILRQPPVTYVVCPTSACTPMKPNTTGN